MVPSVCQRFDCVEVLMKINVASVQAFVGTVLAGIVEALDAAPNNCLPLADLTESLREQGLDVTEEQVAGIVAITPELEVARKRGVGYSGERSAPKVKQPGVRKEAQKKEGRIELLRGLLAAGVPLGAELMAELEAFDAAKKAG